MQFTADHVVQFIQDVAARIKERRDELTQLDAAIGDADHGSNLDRGFTAALGKLPSVADKDIGTIVRTTGMTLVSTVGGASGPLYGTAFIRAAATLTDKYEIDEGDLVRAIDAALDGILARGKARRGEKTMVDAIAPGVDLLKASQANDADFLDTMRRSVDAIREGMEATIPMLATKGRASYLGERSIGHQDPGATSAYLMAQVLLESVEAIVNERVG